jgi:hypothetical protein
VFGARSPLLPVRLGLLIESEPLANLRHEAGHRDDSTPSARGRLSDARWLPADEERWAAYLTDDEPAEVVFYCPRCDEREFGDK